MSDSVVEPKIVWMSNDPVLHADEVRQFESAAKVGEPIAIPCHPGLWRITSIEVNGPNCAVHAIPVAAA